MNFDLPVKVNEATYLVNTLQRRLYDLPQERWLNYPIRE